MKTVITHQARGQSQRTTLLSAQLFCAACRAGTGNTPGHLPASGDRTPRQSSVGHRKAAAPASGLPVQWWRRAIGAYFPM